MNLKMKDPVSCLSHLVGVLLAIAGLVLMLVRTDDDMNAMHYVAFSIFGTSMILLYLASTLYHWFDLSHKNTQIFRRIDHIMIFVLIAGTYTPICLIPLNGGWGWAIFGCAWGLAVAGTIFKLFWLTAPRKLYTFIYLFMGWIIIIAIWPLWNAISLPAFCWLVGGGLSYSIGAAIYGLKRPDPWPKFFGFHEVFHLFILVGTFCQFWMIYRYL